MVFATLFVHYHPQLTNLSFSLLYIGRLLYTILHYLFIYFGFLLILSVLFIVLFLLEDQKCLYGKEIAFPL